MRVKSFILLHFEITEVGYMWAYSGSQRPFRVVMWPYLLLEQIATRVKGEALLKNKFSATVKGPFYQTDGS